MAIGPVLHPDDVVANKMSALYGRAFARDFIDATLRSGRYTRDPLLALAQRADRGFDRRIFADALGQALQLDPDDFAQYGTQDFIAIYLYLAEVIAGRGLTLVHLIGGLANPDYETRRLLGQAPGWNDISV